MESACVYSGHDGSLISDVLIRKCYPGTAPLDVPNATPQTPKKMAAPKDGHFLTGTG